MIKAYKTNLKNISFFANVILLFSILIDPTDILFGVKRIAFLFFAVVSLPYAKFKNIFIFVIFYAIYFIAFSVGILDEQQIDYSFAFGVFTSFLFLSYLFWMNNEHLQVFSVFYKLTLIVSIIVISLYVLMSISPILEFAIYSFVAERNHFIIISRRIFLGMNFFMVFYRTAPTVVISLSVALYFLFSKRRTKYFIHSCIFLLCLLFSGTRASMLSAMLILVFFVLFYLLYHKKALLSFVVIFCFAGLFGMLLLVHLLGDIGEESLQVRAGHLESVWMLFSNDPLRFLFIGTGPGSFFYTAGWGEEVVHMEFTYLELIRNYGLIFTLVILTLLCIPFLKIANNRHYDKLLQITLSVGYLAYLFIAGTNPLLISSTGLVVVAVMFYIGQTNILNEMR